MPSKITGLEYFTGLTEIRTEGEALLLLADLGKEYVRLGRDFKFSTSSGEPVDGLEDFLRVAVGMMGDCSVVLTGGRDVDGVCVKGDSVEYDLSRARRLMMGWDFNVDFSNCSYCCYLGADESNIGCTIGESFFGIDGGCPGYSPLVVNSDGGVVRRLDELVMETVGGSL